MDISDAVEIIEVISGDLRKNPSQFSVMRIVGTSVVSHGGTGLSVSVTGGSGSGNVTGFKSSVSGNSLQAQQAANDGESMRALCSSLDALVTELRSGARDKVKVGGLLSDMRSAMGPSVITGVVTQLVNRALGIG